MAAFRQFQLEMSLYVNILGLPDIEHTIFDVHLNQLSTNSSDIESIVSRLRQTSPLKLPGIFERLGSVSYQGKLTGTYYDFEADGIVETSLGVTNTSINLNIRNEGQYRGKISTSEFDLSTLLQHPQLGQSSFDINVAGHGFTLEKINSEVEGEISFLDLSGYRYKNIKLAGEFSEMRFTGNIATRDPTLTMLFDGDINFNPKRPEYTFDATISYANLNRLNLYHQSPLVIESATIASNFDGDALNNMQGSIAIYDLGFQTNSSQHHIDSLVLEANGNEAHRTMHLYSDIAEATVNGEMDLTTLSNYFKTVAMRYAPSLELDEGPIGRQSFDVDIQLKDVIPITAIIAPTIVMNEGARLNGRFSSTDHTADINILIPELSYGMVNINRLIIDESAKEDALRVLLTADRISLTDSIYVNNVNLSNVMANDSLYVNLKLSDVTASNQLDLNGLVNFRRGESTQVRLLSSALTLNNEAWQLDDNAVAYVGSGEVDLRGFGISNQGQVARLAGIISKSSDRNMMFTFKNFDLATFNPLITASSIKLSGVLDGHMEVSSILETPYAVADMIASDIRVNDREVGDALLQADFDQVNELINVNITTTLGDTESFKLSGTYNASTQNDQLNLTARFNRTELILFQPLLGKLVSNISGTVSADLQITGSALSPQISGKCRLNGASFTVNYLKTPYRIDSEFELENSIIILDNLIITDPTNNRAIANGRIDMKNPLVPVIQAHVSTTDFLVLNTTFSDNPSYYGTAYGTGDFSFIGPTNAIQINIQASTDEATRFHIPLNAVGTVNENDFIQFISQDTTGATQTRPRIFQGVSMNMDLQVTPGAETSLYTDLGELTGRGEGSLSLRVSSLGDFEMFGDYTINTGKFTFTAQDFINKIFEINEGGTIRWSGRPTDATISIGAVYGQRTSLGPLNNAAGRESDSVSAESDPLAGPSGWSVGG